MLIKASLLGCALLSTPLCIVATTQDKAPQEPAPAVTPAPVQRPQPVDGRLEALRAKVKELESALDRAQAATRAAAGQAEAAVKRASELRAELNESLDLLEKSTVRVRHRNCTPRRSRSLLTYYQWMRKRGHQERADRMINEVVKESRGKTSQLNELAWRLMTRKESAGKFDQAALALAQRMQKQGNLRHNQFDTVALALFLNGLVKEAVEQQRHAIAKGGNSEEYRRRLRVYEAALDRQPAGDAVGVGGGN